MVAIARRIHLYPCRTQKLSFLAPRVVGGRLPARIGRCHAKWRFSSAGRASALQAEGHRFEPCRSHLPNQCMSCRCGSMAEQLICNQQVIGSSPIIGFGIRPNNMGEFPSGQRGQTVNLLALPSVVRIHFPPLHSFDCELTNWCGDTSHTVAG